MASYTWLAAIVDLARKDIVQDIVRPLSRLFV